MIARIVAFFPHWGVDCDIGDHPPADELLFDIAAHQFAALLVGQLMRQGEVDFAGELGVASTLSLLHGIPKLTPVGHPFRRLARPHDFGMHHATPFAVIMNLASARVLQPRARPVGGGRYGRTPGATLDDLG